MVFIRVDANETIASGHMMRCMTIAKELVRMNEEVEFLLSDERSAPLLKNAFQYQILHTRWENPNTETEIGLLKKILTDCQENKHTLPVLLVDSYYVDNRYFTKLRPFAKLAFMDDLFEDIYDVDLLINYTITHELFNYREKYRKSHIRLLLGAEYTPLREQFLVSRQKLNQRKPQDSHTQKLQVLLMCGGGDSFDFLSHFLSLAIRDQYFGDYDYHVVSGAYNPYWEKIQRLSQKHENIYFYRNIENMAELMEKCDAAVSAAGTTLYECCAMGLPTIFFCMADNQEYDIDIFSRDGKMIYAGDIRSEKEAVIQQVLLQLHILKCSKSLRDEMSRKVRSIVDGYGSRRIANVLKRILEIGSFFELADNEIETGGGNFVNWIQKICDGKEMGLWNSGRAAIEAAIIDIEKRYPEISKTCLLPSYTCRTVVIPFIRHDWKLFFYDIDEKLSVNAETLASKVEAVQPSVLLAHTYYGTDTLADVRKLITKFQKEKKLIFIEDMTQSMFLLEKDISQADYLVGSLRKWLNTPDGGFCISDRKLDIADSGEYTEYIQAKTDAQRKKRHYLDGDVYSSKKDFLSINNRAESLLYQTTDLYSISDITKAALTGFDMGEIKKRRQYNAEILDKGMQTLTSVTPIIHIDRTISPLYYPIYAEDRSRLQKYLAEQNIFAPVLWDIPVEVTEEMSVQTQYIYDHILALPCDHRYDDKDMHRIITCLKLYKGE